MCQTYSAVNCYVVMNTIPSVLRSIIVLKIKLIRDILVLFTIRICFSYLEEARTNKCLFATKFLLFVVY